MEQYLGSDDYNVHRSIMLKVYKDKGIDYASYGLTESQAVTLFAYTDNLHVSLNKGLRANTADKKLLAVRDDLNAALDKMPKYKGIVHREVDLNEKLINDIIKKDTYKDKTFTSTSELEERSFVGNVKFVIKSKTGRSVSQLSAHNHELEVLFKTDVEFKIRQVMDFEDFIEIKMEER